MAPGMVSEMDQNYIIYECPTKKMSSKFQFYVIENEKENPRILYVNRYIYRHRCAIIYPVYRLAERIDKENFTTYSHYWLCITNTILINYFTHRHF
jgi:hypothetical protein